MQVDSDPRRFDRFLQLARRAMEIPDVPVLFAPFRQPLTYSRPRTHIEATRHALHAAGLGPGEVAALVMRGTELITAFLAIAGESACAPLNPSLTEEEYRFYLSRLGPRLLLVQDDLAPPAISA